MPEPLKILEKEDVDSIHAASLEVLEKVGVRVDSLEALDLLAQNGYSVDKKSRIVRMSGPRVIDAVKNCAHNFRWRARAEKHSFDFVDGRTKFGPGAQCLLYIDPYNAEVRQATLRDGVLATRLADALDTCSLGYVPLYPSDVVEDDQGVVLWIAGIVNSSKPAFGGWGTGESWEHTLRLVDILLGDRELLRKNHLFPGYIDPISPLGHDKSMTATLMKYAEWNQPVFVMAMALAGGTAPASLAGLLVQQNAEILSAIAIAACVTKHPKIVYGSVSCPLDMRSGIAATGTPEFSLLGAASVQMAKSYGLPSDMGVQSDSKTVDAQTSYEKMQSALMAVLSRADFAELFMGSTETFNAFSPVQMVIDDEIASYVNRISQGISVNEESLSLDVISKTGPLGSYLGHPKTLSQFKREHSIALLSDRSTRQMWNSNGAKRAELRAKERMGRLLDEHSPEPLEPEVRRELEKFLHDLAPHYSIADLERFR